jgi:hypothetical protein
MLDNCFVQLPNLQELEQCYVDEVLLAEFPSALHFAESNNGHVNRIKSSFGDSKLCADLRAHFNVDVFAEYYKNEPHSFHTWHRDAIRSCAINYLLTDVPNSYTLFGRKISISHFQTIECKYTLLQPVLFNTTVPHSIINNSDFPRYLLSVTIGTRDNAVKFEDAKNFLINYKSNLTGS